VPIEQGGYRAWKGKTRGLPYRILSIARCELKYKLKRPAIIVTLVLLGLYTLFSALPPILGSIFEGEDMFISDPNSNFNQYQVPDIVVTGVSISNTNEPLEHIENGLELYDLGLEPGQTAVYQLEITNIGTRSGYFIVRLDEDARTNAWDVRLIEGSIPLDRRGDDPPGGAVDDADTRTRQSDGDRPDPNGTSGINDYNEFNDLLLELGPNSPKIVSVIVYLNEDNVSFDTLALILTVENYIDWFEYDEDSAAYYWANIRLDLFTKITGPAISLKPFVKVELAGVKDPSGTWSKDRMKNIYNAPPGMKWGETLEFTFSVTNTGDQTIYVLFWLNRDSYYDSGFYSWEGDYSRKVKIPPGWDFYEEKIMEIKSGESETFTITEIANIGEAPIKRYPQLTFTASDREGGFHDDIGQNLSFVSVPYKVTSSKLPVDDETADYFFNIFYTGGVNIWVILMAVIAGSGLIADDRANKTLPLYYSKAIPKYGYLAGKFLGLAAMIALVTVVWSNLWFTAIMLVGGFSWQFFSSHLWIMGAFTLYGLIVTFFMTALVLAASSLAKNRYIVGASVFAMFLISAFLSVIISEVTREDNYLMLSPSADFIFIGHTLFDLGTPEVDWGYALMVLAGTFIFFMGVLYWQLVRREVNIE